MTRQKMQANPLLNGSPLPPFALQGLNGQIVRGEDAQRTRGLVVAFIHGTWCPYCVRQIVRLNRAFPHLAELEVGLVCISKDPEVTISAYQATSSPPLQFPLLADSEPSVSHLFGVYDPDHESPYPSVFYADKEGKIAYTDVSSDPDCYPNMNRLVEVIRHGNRALPPVEG